MTRREQPISLLRRRLLATPLVAASFIGSNNTLAGNICKTTPTTEDGPLYPPQVIPLASDLTQVPGKKGIAKGQALYIYGQVLNHRCEPIVDATVEIWQADINGYYKHPRAIAPGAIDPFWEITAGQLDPYFRYFSQVKSDDEGRYKLKTIIPRWYNVFGINRAAHIHFKARSISNGVMTTEMYFPGDEQAELQANDRVYQSRYQRSELIVSLEDNAPDIVWSLPDDSHALYSRFDLVFA